MSGIHNGATFLISTIFDIYLVILLVRIILEYRQISFINPVAQFIHKVTQPLIKPLMGFVPTIAGINIASVLLLVVLTVIKITILTLVLAATLPSLSGLFLWLLGSLFGLILDVYFFAILIRVLMSWIPQLQTSPLASIVTDITEPLMALPRRLIPPISGFDISPIVLIIVIKLIDIVIANPIMLTGYQLALR